MGTDRYPYGCVKDGIRDQQLYLVLDGAVCRTHLDELPADVRAVAEMLPPVFGIHEADGLDL